MRATGSSDDVGKMRFNGNETVTAMMTMMMKKIFRLVNEGNVEETTTVFSQRE